MIADPGASAVLSDVDGTLAPIVDRAEAAAVPAAARELLRGLAGGYGLVACLSGRRATEARRLVGVEAIVYVGNHGYERLDPGAPEAQPLPALRGHESDAPRFVAGLDRVALERVGLRLEDKGPIQALHWRGVRDPDEAEAAAGRVGGEAEAADLLLHHGRQVLEIRPPVPIDKGIAVDSLLRVRGLDLGLYAGDDRTDVDAFRGLRGLVAAKALRSAVCIGIGSDEAPAELIEAADSVVDGPEGFLDVLRTLARASTVAD